MLFILQEVSHSERMGITSSGHIQENKVMDQSLMNEALAPPASFSSVPSLSARDYRARVMLPFSAQAFSPSASRPTIARVATTTISGLMLVRRRS